MKRVNKLLAFCLTLALVLVLLPATLAYARPKTLDMSKIKTMGMARSVKLTFGQDLVFYGKLANTAIDDKKLDEIIEQTLKEMKLTDADYDNWTKQVDQFEQDKTLTPEKMQQIKDNIFDMIGVAPGLNKATSVAQHFATLLQIVDQARDGRGIAAEETAAEWAIVEYVKNFAKNYGDDFSDKVSNAADVYAWAKALNTMFNELKAEQQLWDNMKNGLNALKSLTKFHDWLNRNIEDYLAQNADKKWTIKFDKDKDRCPTTMFGTHPEENWTLDMTLNQKSAQTPGGWQGTYEGLYQITIDYDMSNFVNQLPTAIYNIGWASSILIDGLAFNKFDNSIILTNPGVCEVKRELFGAATVKITQTNPKDVIRSQNIITIDWVEDASVKTVNISGISLDAIADLDGYGTLLAETGFDISADNENSLNIQWRGLDIGNYLPGGLPIQLPDNCSPRSGTVPWDSSFWQRSDKPKPLIKLMPYGWSVK